MSDHGRSRSAEQRPIALGAVLGVATVLLLVGCGDATTDQVASLETGGAEAGSAGGSTDPADAEAAAVEFVECMRGEGFDLPDPSVDADGNVSLGGGQAGGPGGGPLGGGAGAGGGAGGVDGGVAEEFAAASEACGGVPEGLFGGFGQQDQTSLQDAAIEFAQCLRDGGLEVDDPDFSGGGGTAGGSDGGPGGPGAGGGLFGGLDLDDPEVVAVVEDCQALLADAGFPGGGDGGEEGSE